MKKSRHTRALKSLESSDSEKENAPRHVKTEKCVDNPLSTIEPSSYASMNGKTLLGKMYFLNIEKTFQKVWNTWKYLNENLSYI